MKTSIEIDKSFEMLNVVDIKPFVRCDNDDKPGNAMLIAATKLVRHLRQK